MYRSGLRIPRQLLNIHYLDFSSGNARDESLLRSLIHAPQRLVGRVLSYYDRIGVAGVILEGRLRLGDTIRITGPGADLSQVENQFGTDKTVSPRVSNYFIDFNVRGNVVQQIAGYYQQSRKCLAMNW